MRFDEFVLRVAGDEFRIRFHPQLTVLAGIGAEERQALVSSVVGALTGESDETVLTCTDHTGRPVELRALGGRVSARFTDESGGPAPVPVGWFAPDAAALRSLLVVSPRDLGLAPSDEPRPDDPPELAAARESLQHLNTEHRAARDTHLAVESATARVRELDEAIRIATNAAERCQYAGVIAELERVQAELDALDRGDEGLADDEALLEEAPSLHQLAGCWVDAADTLDELRASVGEEPPGPEDAWLVDVPVEAPPQLGTLFEEVAEADRHVAEIEARLHDLAAAGVAEPENPAVLALATVDQDDLWSAHAALLEARARSEQEELNLGGIGHTGPPSEAVEALEDAHHRYEDADSTVEERRVGVIAGAALIALLALPARAVSPVLALLLLAGVLAGVAALLGRPLGARRAARRDEAAALAPLGVSCYLAFHMRRVDATLDPSGRDRLELAAADVGLAHKAWAAVAGDIDHDAAGHLEDEVRSYAAELAHQHGAVDALGDLRRHLDTEALPARQQTRHDLLEALRPFGIDQAELDGVTPEVVAAVVAARVELGERARHQQLIDQAEAVEESAAAHLDRALARIGYTDGALTTRFEAAGWAIEQAGERQAARESVRTREEIEADRVRLESEAGRLRRPEFATVSADEASGPDVAALTAERDQVEAELQARRTGGADLDRIDDRRAALERRVAALEARITTRRAEHADDLNDVHHALLAHLGRAAKVGPLQEPVPVLLDDPLVGVPAERKWEMMDMLRRLGERTQVLYLTDDPFVGAWARRRAQVDESITLLEPVDG